eukprot:TRINITY_DN30363_c0_g1_i1.p1 TRINITY_DN30363_c0_g1~~TRINITY_DN30363_c0_g1_i1.p1  ORF type:complete len:225 (-),score=35.19 TRINITY_DN30363_c0_g1_i1:125-799(-)
MGSERRKYGCTFSFLLMAAAVCAYRQGAFSSCGMAAASSIYRGSSRGGLVSVAAFPWEGSGSALAERVYATWLAAYPKAAERGSFFGQPCDRSTIIERFQSLTQFLGPEVAADIAEYEPKLLLFRKEYVAEAWRLLKVLEEGSQAAGQDITALQVVQKNPSLLTCEAYSLSGTDLAGLDSNANAVSALRSVGLKADAIPTLITLVVALTLSVGQSLRDAGALPF